MNPGEAFEIKCFEYLKSRYGNKFVHEGSMDSTVSDIAVLKNFRTDFYIEAKDAAAQSGQFVLLPDENTRTFVFSPRNRSLPNEMTDIIIQYMNQDFDRFNHAGTAGEPLDIQSHIFADWIIGHYQEKNVRYVITYGNDYVIFPVRKFAEYFDIHASYRIKKSGSGKPAQRDFPVVTQAILNVYPSATFTTDGKNLFATVSDNIVQDRFVLGKYTYYFSQKDPDLYEITRLSNTYNMNVIFSIRLKRSQDMDDLQEFESDLL